nr:M48 family metallopeptidase [Pleomorphomonas sp. NRK KF1]
MASDEPVAVGEWHPPNTSRSISADLREDGDGLSVIADGAICAAASETGVEISPRVGSIPRRLTFPDGSVFETADNDGVDAWLRRHRGARSGLIHGLEAFRPRLFVFVVAVILFAFAIYRYAVPALVEVAVFATPPFVPEMIGSGALASLDRTVLEPSQLPEDEKQAISDGFARLAVASEGGPTAYKLNFRDGGSIGPNAFALPDGNLILTDDLVKLADGDREMILGVLGHEIAHVERKHSLRQIYRVAGVTAMILLIAGDVGSGLEDMLTQGGAILALSYSRAAETEADRRSVEIMRAAGYEPTALVRFFDRIEAVSGKRGDVSFLSTHPDTPERRADVLSYARELESGAPAR